MFLLAAAIIVAAFLFYSWSNGAFSQKTNLSTASIKPQSPHYLSLSDGNESEIFLVSAQPSYGYWTQNDTHMDWFVNGPVIHTGDPVFIINVTVRNDYTQSDQNQVNSDNISYVVLTVTLYNKTGSVIAAPQAYPQVDTNYFGGHEFAFSSGKTASFLLYLATSSRDVDHYEITVAVVASMPPPKDLFVFNQVNFYHVMLVHVIPCCSYI